ncbi:MAG: putative toxin-antitoxin system toxin component, PIN family [Pseudomonadota bacterium]
MILAVLDSNIWVSAVHKPDGVSGRVLRAWQQRDFEAHIPAVAVVEVARVLARPKLIQKYQIRWTHVLRFVGDLVAGSTVHAVPAPPRRCRDQTDDAFLELAVRLAPSCLVSGDGDVANDPVLAKSVAGLGVELLSPAGFLLRLGHDHDRCP